MPFLPPVSIARSVSGLTGKDSSCSSLASMANKSREDRGGSVKERISLNLKQLGGKKGNEAAPGAADARRRLDKANRGHKQDSITARTGQTAASRGGVRGAELRSRLGGGPEEAHFTLTLTPEAVLLLQRRSCERAGGGGHNDARASGRRRETPSKRRSASSHAASPKVGVDSQVDLRSILKISLLNDRHKYDDVEYEEEDYTMDQRVALKCTEWLRGLESPLTSVTAAVGGVVGGKGKSG